MARTSPLTPPGELAQIAPYAPPNADPIEVVAAYESIELEYASLRKSCVIIDLPQRGTIELVGDDRLAFLDRMLTQKLADLPPMHTCRAFWLARTGRVIADLRVTDLDGRTRLDLDAHAVAPTLETLEPYIIMDDVQLADATDRLHRLLLIGPDAIARLGDLAEPIEGPALCDLEPDTACIVRVIGHRVLVERDDTMGEIGLLMTMPVQTAREVWEAIADAGVRPAGWHALNIARVEAGTPMFALDFGPASLPHETGVIDDRVSFTKGCYLGQEIVARMASRGSVRKLLVGLRLMGDRAARPDGSPRQPDTGSPIFTPDAADETSDRDHPPVGAVTSSVLSPMLSNAPICLAVVAHAHADPGTALLVEADAALVDATVQPTLRFWPRATDR